MIPEVWVTGFRSLWYALLRETGCIAECCPAKQFTLFNQLQDGYSGKLLGDRANPENHARLHGYLQFKIGTSKCLLVNDVPLSCNQYGNAGLILF